MEYFNDDNKKDNPLELWDNKSPRDLAKWLGTDIYRIQFDNDIWLKNMDLRIKEHSKPDSIIIITDCRFDNEAQFIQERCGEIWKVDASNRIIQEVDKHPSENGISDGYIDVHFDNNLDVKCLDEQVKLHFT